MEFIIHNIVYWVVRAYIFVSCVWDYCNAKRKGSNRSFNKIQLMNALKGYVRTTGSDTLSFRIVEH